MYHYKDHIIDENRKEIQYAKKIISGEYLADEWAAHKEVQRLAQHNLEVRKETAKEILQRLCRSYKDIDPIITVLKIIAEEYGVEVEE